MKRLEHLLFCLAEECAEVAQRASKAARFHLDEVQQGQAYTNWERIGHEMADLIGVYKMMADEHLVPTIESLTGRIYAKKAKVEKFLLYSKEMGTLS